MQQAKYGHTFCVCLNSSSESNGWTLLKYLHTHTHNHTPSHLYDQTKPTSWLCSPEWVLVKMEVYLDSYPGLCSSFP